MISMRAWFIITAAVAGLFSASYAHSQTCGPDEVQSGGGNAGYILCTPIAATLPPRPPVSLENPGPQWASRWGAIAVDEVAGKFAGIEGFESKRRAQKSAISECKKSGGKKCKVVISYHNQCGVLAGGDTMSTSSSGPDIDETIGRAVSRCSASTQNCKPYYTGCSYPVRVR